MSANYPDSISLRRGASPQPSSHESEVLIYCDEEGIVHTLQSDGTDWMAGTGRPGAPKPPEIPTVPTTTVERFAFTGSELPFEVPVPAGTILPGTYLSVTVPFAQRNLTLALQPQGQNPISDSSMLAIPAEQPDSELGSGFSYPPSYVTGVYTADGTQALEVVAYDAWNNVFPIRTPDGEFELVLIMAAR